MPSPSNPEPAASYEDIIFNQETNPTAVGTWNHFVSGKHEYRSRMLDGHHYLEKKTYLTENSSIQVMQKAAAGEYPLNDIVVHGGGYYCYLLEGWTPVSFEDSLFTASVNKQQEK